MSLISGLVKVTVTSPAGLMKFFLNVEPCTIVLAVPKTSLTNLLKYLSGESIVVIIFEGEMVIRTLQTTLLQMFCFNILNFHYIVTSIIVPDVNFTMITNQQKWVNFFIPVSFQIL